MKARTKGTDKPFNQFGAMIRSTLNDRGKVHLEADVAGGERHATLYVVGGGNFRHRGSSQEEKACIGFGLQRVAGAVEPNVMGRGLMGNEDGWGEKGNKATGGGGALKTMNMGV